MKQWLLPEESDQELASTLAAGALADAGTPRVLYPVCGRTRRVMFQGIDEIPMPCKLPSSWIIQWSCQKLHLDAEN